MFGGFCFKGKVMNQILKDVVYGKGTQKQIDFIAEIGGMNEEETKIFNMIHRKVPDEVIQDELGICKNSYRRVEESIRAKLTIAIFECINCHMEEMENKGSF